MLQQTRVDTVVPYWLRWTARWPCPAALAAAAEDEVTAMWSGLGYYRRARNLHKGAQAVVASHGGALPASVEGLKSLPGVGAYTAGAIASIAFGLPAPVVDGNVVRVLARLRAVAADAKSKQLHALCWRLAGCLVRGGAAADAALPSAAEATAAGAEAGAGADASLRAGDFNQAMMELGATICTPTSPSCSVCPLRAGGLCRAVDAALSIAPAPQPGGSRNAAGAAPAPAASSAPSATSTQKPVGGRQASMLQYFGAKPAAAAADAGSDALLAAAGQRSRGAEAAIGGSASDAPATALTADRGAVVSAAAWESVAKHIAATYPAKAAKKEVRRQALVAVVVEAPPPLAPAATTAGTANGAAPSTTAPRFLFVRQVGAGPGSQFAAAPAGAAGAAGDAPRRKQPQASSQLLAGMWQPVSALLAVAGDGDASPADATAPVTGAKRKAVRRLSSTSSRASTSASAASAVPTASTAADDALGVPGASLSDAPLATGAATTGAAAMRAPARETATSVLGAAAVVQPSAGSDSDAAAAALRSTLGWECDAHAAPAAAPAAAGDSSARVTFSSQSDCGTVTHAFSHVTHTIRVQRWQLARTPSAAGAGAADADQLLAGATAAAALARAGVQARWVAPEEFPSLGLSTWACRIMHAALCGAAQAAVQQQGRFAVAAAGGAAVHSASGGAGADADPGVAVAESHATRAGWQYLLDRWRKAGLKA
jgi:adenine-specific DNA glycosylase